MAKVCGAKERKKANTNPLILMRSRPHHLILKSVYIQSKCRVRLKSSMSSRTREHTKKRSWLLLYACTIVWCSSLAKRAIQPIKKPKPF
jgi:hypothetical protein